VVKNISIFNHNYLYDDSNELERQMFEEHEYERKSRERLFEDLKPRDIFVDIGSAHGSWTVPATSLGAKTIAFDINEQGLPKNMKLNNFDYNFFKSVLWYRSGLPRHLKYWSAIPCNNREKPDLLTSKLDDYDLKPDYMKIDVEGNELEVLRGSEQTIMKYKPRMIVESHDFTRQYMYEYVIELVKSFNPLYNTHIEDQRLTRDDPLSFHLFFY
jgi:FkbM family methyltransferase